MPLHLIKLAVGCESVKELKGWVAERMATARKKGLPLRHMGRGSDVDPAFFRSAFAAGVVARGMLA